MKRSILLAVTLFSGLAMAENVVVINGQRHSCPDGTTLTVMNKKVSCKARNVVAPSSPDDAVVLSPEVPSDEFNQMDDKFANLRKEMDQRASDLRQTYGCEGNLVVLNGQATCDGVAVEAQAGR